MSLIINDLTFTYGGEPVLLDLKLEIPRNRVSCILGPSGCGKTTLLKLIAALLPLDRGEILGMEEETVGFIFQEPRLLPWRTLFANLDLILRKTFPQKGERKERIDSILEMVKLSAYRDYYPGHLSGGMRQRASLARAFAYPSSLLLMDEAFQALDPVLKLNLVDDFLRLHRTDRRTCLLVTHDVEEATLAGDEIFIFSPKPGRVFRKISNPVVPEKRISHGRDVLDFEHELFRILLEASGEKRNQG